MATTTKKGLSSLKEALEFDLQREPARADEWRAKYVWVLERAQQYADFWGTTRARVLEAWESKRDYWWMNCYQDCNQPDLKNTNGTPVVTFETWKAEGIRRFGHDQLDWQFQCPQCKHIQTPREFKEAGIEPEYCFSQCASRHNLGGSPTCKWTTGGLFRIGGQYVIAPDFNIHLIFGFAPEENK